MVTGLVSRETLTVFYDADCGVCTHVSRALQRLDGHHRLTFVALQSADIPGAPSREELINSLHARDGAGRWFSGGKATVEIARRVPALRIVAVTARLPGAMAILNLGYDLVAANRQSLSRVLGLKACQLRASVSGRPAR